MKIMIGTPTYDGKLDVNYISSLLDTLKQASELGITIYPLFMAYDALVQRSRNDIFQTAYKAEVDFLFFIDADISWNPSDFFKLILNENHIVGGTYRKKTDNEELYVIKVKEEDIKNKKIPINENGLIEVEGLGMGFTRIDKYAIKKIWDNSQKYIENTMEKAFVFNVEIRDNLFTSEDIIFCKNWINLNEKIYLDSNITLNHTGIKTFQGNFNEYLSNLANIKD